MAAPTTEIAGNAFALSIGGTALGASTSATLRVEAENPDVTNKDSANWAEMVAGARRHGYDFEGFYAVGGTEVAVDEASASISIGGTALKGWTTATLTLSCELLDRVNWSTGLDRAVSPKRRQATLTVSGAYYDPGGTGAGALDDLLGEVLGTTSSGLAVVVTFGTSQAVSFTLRPGSVRVVAATGDNVQLEINGASTGAVTVSDTGADAGLAALVTAWEAEGASGSVTALFATDITDAATFTSTAYVRELRL